MSKVKCTLLADGGGVLSGDSTWTDSEGNRVKIHGFYFGNQVEYWKDCAEKAEARVKKEQLRRERVECILLTALEALIKDQEALKVAQYIQLNYGEELKEHTRRRVAMIPNLGVES